MHRLGSAAARPELREYVRAYAQREVESAAGLVQAMPATLEDVIEFDFADFPEVDLGGRRAEVFRTSLVGVHTGAGATLRLAGRVESFAIFFQPCALWRLFRIPSAELTNRSCDGEALGGGGLRELWEVLAECRGFAQRVAKTEAFLLRRAAKAAGLTPVMRSAQHLFGVGGRVGIQRLAQENGLSLRHFERRFTSELGLRPKHFGRIARFQMALDAKVRAPGRSWLKIAHACGYHDQMHMIREFRSLCGESPERLLAGLGDMRPPALAGEGGQDGVA